MFMARRRLQGFPMLHAFQLVAVARLADIGGFMETRSLVKLLRRRAEHFSAPVAGSFHLAPRELLRSVVAGGLPVGLRCRISRAVILNVARLIQTLLGVVLALRRVQI